LPNARPISCNDCPAFQRRHMSLFCTAESPNPSGVARTCLLADMIGTTRSRVNMFMNKFRKLGFIEYNGEIKVNKPLLSLVLCE
jgi:hypothetical protein